MAEGRGVADEGGQVDAALRSLTAPSRRETLEVAIGALLFASVFCYPIISHLGEPGSALDWDQVLFWSWVSHHSVSGYHQVPLWNPYACGGMPMLANPQSCILTPFFLLRLIAGPVVGLHLEIVLHLALTFAGGYVLGRVSRFSPVGAIATALVFASCSTQFLRIAVGHGHALAYSYLPWIAAGAVASLDTGRLLPAGLGGVALAIAIGEGGIYAGPHALVLIVLLAVTAAIRQRRAHPIVVLAVMGLVAFGFAAPKLLPMLRLMRTYPRLIESPEVTSWPVIFAALFSRNPLPVLPSGYWEYHEYGAYIGPATALLALVGLRMRWRAIWPWVIAAAVFLLLALGDLGPLSPWSLLHHLPLFASHHVPSRFLVLFVFSAAVIAGAGADALVRMRRRWPGVVAVSLVVAGTVDAFMVGPPALYGAFVGPVPSLVPAQTFRQVASPDREMFAHAVANMGTTNCYEPLDVKSAARAQGDSDYSGEEWLTGPGDLRLARWSPNELQYDVNLAEPAVLILNQNFDTGWTLAAGDGVPFSHQGRLAVRLPAGPQRVVLRYRDPLFVWGLGCAVASLLILLALWRRDARVTRPFARARSLLGIPRQQHHAHG